MNSSLFYLLVAKTFFVDCSMYLKIIEEFVAGTRAKSVTFFTCFSKNDTKVIDRIVTQMFIPSSFMTTVGSIELNFCEKSYQTRTNVGSVQDLACAHHEKVEKMVKICNLYQSQFKWLIFDSTQDKLSDFASIKPIFTNTSLRMDSDVTVALFESENKTLYDIYSPGRNGKNEKVIKVDKIGFWKPHNKNSCFSIKNQEEYARRRNMTGVTIKSAIVNTHPDLTMTMSVDAYYRDLATKNYDTINKLNYGLFMHVQEIHNFSLRLSLTDKWFGNAEGGQVDGGLAKLLFEGRIDFGATSGLIKPDRVPVIDFVAPTYPFRTCFIFRHTKDSGTQLENQFLKPFSSSVWFTTLAFILLFCTVLKLAFLAERITQGDLAEHSFIAGCLITWAVFCQQGTALESKITSGRCILLTLLLLSLILYNFYVSIIVSSLLGGLPPPLSTIEELSHSNLDVAVEDIVYTRTLFEVTKDPRLKYLYDRKIRNSQPSPYQGVEEGIARVKAGGFAYHTEPPTGYPLIERTFEPFEICDLAEINLFTPTVLWVMAQKRSQYKGLFGVGYLKMLESGIIVRQRSMWITKKPSCLSNAHLVQVGIQPISPAFLVLFLGLVVSLCLLVLEIFILKSCCIRI